MESDDGHNDSGIEKRIALSTHVLLVPMVQQGHAVTAFRFAKKLSRRGVAVTLVMIKQHADELQRIYTQELLQSLRINIEALDTYQPPQIPSPLHQSWALKAAFQPFKEELIAKKTAPGFPGYRSTYTCMVADRFLLWIGDIAKELDIPRYSYACNAGITVRLMQLYHEKEEEFRSLPNGPDWFQRCYEIVRKQPGLEFLKKATDIPELTIESGWFDYYCDIGRAFTEADGIIFNSFYALEHQSVDAIRNAYPGSNKFKVPPVHPVGPLSTLEEFNNESFTAGLEDSHPQYIEWLEAQPSKSVLYVCLGSQVRLFSEQISHLARALEGSQCRFLWVLSKGRGNFKSVEEVLPPSYLERVGTRGKIVTGWVRQLEILSSQALAGFLSHCGWQSVIEALTYGVPVLGWPHVAEQRLNCRYIEEVLKVGMRVTEKETNELVEQHEFEEAIKTFMSEKARTVIAASCGKVKSLAAQAMADGGPSDVALDDLVELFSKHNGKEVETNGNLNGT